MTEYVFKPKKRKLGRPRKGEVGGQLQLPDDIVEMICSPYYLGDEDISPAQLAVVKAIYGLEMTAEERQPFMVMTEGREPRKGGYYEATVIAGTGSGKTEKILANICVWEAISFDVTKLTDGEVAVVPLVAQDEKAARIALDYCEAKLRILTEKGLPCLLSSNFRQEKQGGPKDRDVVGGKIRVKPNVEIRTYPCKRVSTRGISAIAGGMDEFAHWRTEANAYNSDREIQRAIRGRRRAHTPNLRLVKITSPYGEEGVAFEDFKERTRANRLFVHAPTWMLNPALSRESMAEEEHDDPEAFMRERGAEFGKIGGGYISGALVDSCTRPDRMEILPEPHLDYMAAMDVAFKGDLYVVGVAHYDAKKVVFDGIWYQQGSKERPLNDEQVAEQMGMHLRPYGIEAVIGDQFADVPTRSEYQKWGIKFILEAQTAASNMVMFKTLKSAMRRRLIELPPDPEIRKDLTSLIQTKTIGSPIWRCGAPERSGMHDDISKVIAILTTKLLPAVHVDVYNMNRQAVQEDTREQWKKGSEMEQDIMGAIW